MMMRLQRYTIGRWASEFIKSLEGVKEIQEFKLTREDQHHPDEAVIDRYKETNKRILFLDYDGTLAWFKKNPEDAKPDEQLYEILQRLSNDPSNTLVIISGRDKETLSRWFEPKWNHPFCGRTRSMVQGTRW